MTSKRAGSASSTCRPTPPRPSRSRCCSGTSVSSSTRATRRWPNGGRRRWRSTPACSPSCSAAPSCVSCSTPRPCRRSRRSPAAAHRAASPGSRRRRRPPARGRRPHGRRGRRPWRARGLAGRARRLPPGLQVRIAGQERHVAIEDAGRPGDALGTALPVGVPEVFTEPVADPLGDLIGRYARTTGRSSPPRPPPGWAWASPSSPPLCSGSPAPDAWSPGSSAPEAAARSATPTCSAPSGAAAWPSCARRWEPVPIDTLARFTPPAPVGGRLRGADGVLAVVEQLAGALVPASAWSRSFCRRACATTPPRCSTS